MNIAYKLYGKNERGIPPEHVKESRMTSEEELDGYIVASEEEFDTYYASVKPLYEAYKLGADLEKAKDLKKEVLWKSATAFQLESLSDGSLAYCMIAKMNLNNVKAIANCTQADTIWGTYYVRKQEIDDALTSDAVDAVKDSFASVGELPHSMKEIMSEINV